MLLCRDGGSQKGKAALLNELVRQVQNREQ